MFFKKLLILVCVIVERGSERKTEAVSVEPVEPQQKLIQTGHNHVIAVGHGLAQLFLYAIKLTQVWQHVFSVHVEMCGVVMLIAVQQAVHEILV